MRSRSSVGETPPSSVSREERVYRDPSGLLSIAGGKLTTYRAMGEKMVGQVVGRLSASRRRQLSPSRTRRLPLRTDDFEREAFESELCREFGVTPARSEHLVRSYGASARSLLDQASPEQRRPIGTSRFTLAEIPWCMKTECPANLCDLLERRVRAIVPCAVLSGLPSPAR